MIEIRVERMDNGFCSLAIYDNDEHEMLAYTEAAFIDTERVERMGEAGTIQVFEVPSAGFQKLAAGCQKAARRTKATIDDSGV